MLDILEGLIKGLGILFRLALEGGVLLDLSLSGTGRMAIKIIYPPHWGKRVSYNSAVERVVGACLWCLLGYGFYLLYEGW